MIFLYGPPASGKTTLGKRLAEAVGWRFVDLDEAIVQAAGRPIRDIFAADGEPAFRKLESETLVRVVEAAGASTIVALGGGTLLNPGNRAFAEAHGSVWCLDAPSAEERARRIAAGGNVRPLG
ncbi:MAG: shikimate kinase, partial [Kiritimatiellae bacterium]|nr:shikimate kinase [Kiritimatiellia bacterium]